MSLIFVSTVALFVSVVNSLLFGLPLFPAPCLRVGGFDLNSSFRFGQSDPGPCCTPFSCSNYPIFVYAGFICIYIYLYKSQLSISIPNPVEIGNCQ